MIFNKRGEVNNSFLIIAIIAIVAIVGISVYGSNNGITGEVTKCQYVRGVGFQCTETFVAEDTSTATQDTSTATQDTSTATQDISAGISSTTDAQRTGSQPISDSKTCYQSAGSYNLNLDYVKCIQDLHECVLKYFSKEITGHIIQKSRFSLLTKDKEREMSFSDIYSNSIVLKEGQNLINYQLNKDGTVEVSNLDGRIRFQQKPFLKPELMLGCGKCGLADKETGAFVKKGTIGSLRDSSADCTVSPICDTCPLNKEWLNKFLEKAGLTHRYEVKECESAGTETKKEETKKEETPTTTPSTTIEEKNGKIGFSLKLMLGEIVEKEGTSPPSSGSLSIEYKMVGDKYITVWFVPIATETTFCSHTTNDECEADAKKNYPDNDESRKKVLKGEVNKFCSDKAKRDRTLSGATGTEIDKYIKACEEEQMAKYLVSYKKYVYMTSCQKTCCPGNEISCTINAPIQ